MPNVWHPALTAEAQVSLGLGVCHEDFTVSSVKRIVQYHIARLKDKRSEVRLAAIHELELLEDPDALEPLQEVFNHDEDPEVRRVAQEAGRAIFLKHQRHS